MYTHGDYVCDGVLCMCECAMHVCMCCELSVLCVMCVQACCTCGCVLCMHVCNWVQMCVVCICACSVYVYVIFVCMCAWFSRPGGLRGSGLGVWGVSSTRQSPGWILLRERPGQWGGCCPSRIFDSPRLRPCGLGAGGSALHVASAGWSRPSSAAQSLPASRHKPNYGAN